MTDLDDMRAERDAARSLAASLEQECAVRDEALAELRALANRWWVSPDVIEDPGELVLRILDALAARIDAHLFPTDEEGERRPSTDELLGIAPDWCGGLSVDEYVDRQRGRTTDEEGASDE